MAGAPYLDARHAKHLPGFRAEFKAISTRWSIMSEVSIIPKPSSFRRAANALAEVDPVTEKLVRRIAIEERNHVSSLRELLESLMKDKYIEVIRSSFAKYKLSNRISV